MQKVFKYILGCLLVGCLASCELDNESAPQVLVQGNFVYNGKDVPFRNGAVQLSFYEEAYELNDRFEVRSNQDGHFQELIFSGDYELLMDADRGAYENNLNRKKVSVKGATTVDWEVIPYFFVDNVAYSTSGKSISATANISKTSTKDLESVSILISGLSICDRVNKDKQVIVDAEDINDLSSVNLTVDLSDYTKAYCFVRIGIKSVGNSNYNYSKVEKINL